MKIGVQLYTVRKLIKNDLKSTLAVLKSLGINHVEAARMKFTQDHAMLFNEANIEVTSIQVTLRKLIKNYQKILEFCRTTRCNTVVVSVLSISAILGGKRAMIRFCRKLNQTAALYNLHLINFAFHHHDFEFKKINNETKMEILLKNTADNVLIVSDTYWTKKSKIDPVEFINKLGNRLIGLHLRDFSEQTLRNCELGSGSIDFIGVLGAAKNDAKFAMIEQNTQTPIASIKTSIEYLVKNHLVKGESNE